MKSKNLIAVSAFAIGLVAAAGAVQAQSLGKASSEAASLRARVQSAPIVNKAASVGKTAASAQAQKVARSSAASGKVLQTAQKKAPPRGVDQTVTGSVGNRSESCTVRKVDLFDRKGNFVKNERMRVCT